MIEILKAAGHGAWMGCLVSFNLWILLKLGAWDVLFPALMTLPLIVLSGYKVIE